MNRRVVALAAGISLLAVAPGRSDAGKRASLSLKLGLGGIATVFALDSAIQGKPPEFLVNALRDMPLTTQAILLGVLPPTIVAAALEAVMPEGGSFGVAKWLRSRGYDLKEDKSGSVSIIPRRTPRTHFRKIGSGEAALRYLVQGPTRWMNVQLSGLSPDALTNALENQVMGKKFQLVLPLKKVGLQKGDTITLKHLDTNGDATLDHNGKRRTIPTTYLGAHPHIR